MIRKTKFLVRDIVGAWLALTPLPLLVGNVALAAGTPDPNAPEQAKSIVADHIREQGYACDRAEEAHHDASLSKPDQPVWILHCSNAVYRVRLRGNMSANVELLDSKP
jgi:hypothetical protein